MLKSSGVVTWVGLGLGLAAAAGCSWIYDTDNLNGAGAGRDGGDGDGGDQGGGNGDAGPMADADPDALDFQILPGELFEGEGSALDASDLDAVRAVPIVLRGQNLSGDMTVTLDGAGFESVPVDELAVSPDGRWAAFALRVPVLPDVGQGMNDSIQVRVQSFEDQTRALTVRGLDSFEQAGGVIDTGASAIRARYSHVVLSGDIGARGAAPLRLVATAGIEVSGSLHADGAGMAAGAGGCAGGDVGETPSCGAAGGRGAGTVSGGGGGGFGTGGGGGAGSAAGAGGQAAASATLVPLPPASGSTSRGAGGGGGGPLLDLTGGEPGGGGGGVVELTTPAVLRLGAATVTANGAAGTPTGGLGCALAGGSGGSGSGGAILLRAGGALAADPAARVRALGGPQVGPMNCFGGAGGVGRIRIDSAGPVELDDQPAAALGPMIAGDAPVVTRSEAIELSVRGASQSSYDLYLGEANEPAGSVATGADGLGSAEVTLAPGANLVCVSGASPADLAYAEARNCVSIAYVPSDE
ncbi:MAG TPA: hypothetical protein VKB80_15270 [Kofleriaceae bacterium]|nr:hypothetical protein [Kofleriaceae bacterium]